MRCLPRHRAAISIITSHLILSSIHNEYAQDETPKTHAKCRKMSAWRCFRMWKLQGIDNILRLFVMFSYTPGLLWKVLIETHTKNIVYYIYQRIVRCGPAKPVARTKGSHESMAPARARASARNPRARLRESCHWY